MLRARSDDPLTWPNQCTSGCNNFDDAFLEPKPLENALSAKGLIEKTAFGWPISKCEGFHRSSAEKRADSMLLCNNLVYFP